MAKNGVTCFEELEVSPDDIQNDVTTVVCRRPKGHSGPHRGFIYEKHNAETRSWTVTVVEWSRGEKKDWSWGEKEE